MKRRSKHEDDDDRPLLLSSPPPRTTAPPPPGACCPLDRLTIRLLELFGLLLCLFWLVWFVSKDQDYKKTLKTLSFCVFLEMTSISSQAAGGRKKRDQRRSSINV